MLATELALAEASVLVLDKLRERRGQSKALNLQPRTAEVFDLRGLLDRAEERALSHVPDGHFAGLILDYAALGTRHPYQVGIPQGRVEEVLEERLNSYGVQVRRDRELTEFSQDEDGVEVITGSERLRAKYLVGCDGGRSVVRKQLGVGFPGLDASQYGTVADVLLEVSSAGVPMVWTSMRNLTRRRDDGSFAGLIPLGEPGLFRLVYAQAGVVIDDQRAPVPDAEIDAVLRSSTAKKSRSRASAGLPGSATRHVRPRSTASAECCWPAMPRTSTCRPVVRVSTSACRMR
jgi:2-polyprenyl-6-methoxyphenol hydroxylase-like FAD-dependent oxidoreductase